MKWKSGVKNIVKYKKVPSGTQKPIEDTDLWTILTIL
jgi:hypothetical protein